MSEKIVVPALGESVTEATVSKWLKNQGDKVLSDEPLVELETDKVNVEVPSPSNGTLEKISVKEGETVNVGSLLGTVGVSLKSNKNKVEEKKEVEKKYSPPLKKPIKKEIKKKEVNEPLILKDEESKYKDDQEEPLILEENTDEEPLILDNAHEDTEKQKVEQNILLNNS